MSVLSPDFERLLAAAADLRAAGYSWEAVGERLRRKPDTCRRWPSRYARRWRDLYVAAERLQEAELRAEARNVLRRQLRLGDSKQTRDAARALLTAARRDRDGDPIDASDSLETLIDAIPTDRQPDLADAAGRAADPPAAG